ncbi:hypothetical protein L1887_25214 [Cichorium endivia]|nr:hypothetical protein L1887_25214 [Cichorium endivia]
MSKLMLLVKTWNFKFLTCMVTMFLCYLHGFYYPKLILQTMNTFDTCDEFLNISYSERKYLELYLTNYITCVTRSFLVILLELEFYKL